MENGISILKSSDVVLQESTFIQIVGWLCYSSCIIIVDSLSLRNIQNPYVYLPILTRVTLLTLTNAK